MEAVPNPNAAALASFIETRGIKKTVLAKFLKVTRLQLYAYLVPERYPRIRLQQDVRDRIDRYVHAEVLRYGATA